MAWTVWVVLLLQLTSSRAGEATSGCAALLQAAESGDDTTFALHCRSHFSPKDCDAVRRSLGDRPWNSESSQQTCQELLHELPEELEASIRKKETTTEQALLKDSDQLGKTAATTTARLVAPALTPSSTSPQVPSTVAATTATLPTPLTPTQSPSKESSRTKAKAAEATTPTPEPEDLPEVQPPSSPAPITFPATPPPSTHPATTTAATLPQLPAKEDEVKEEKEKRKEEVRYEEDEDDEEDKEEKKAEEKVKQRVEEEEEQDEKDAEEKEREREEEEEEDAEELAITGVAQSFPVSLPAPAAKERSRHERLVAKYQRSKQEPEPFVWYRAPHCNEYLLLFGFVFGTFACCVVSGRRPLTDDEEAACEVAFLLGGDDVV